MKRKLSMLLASLAIAVVGLVGCKGPTEEEYKQWAEDNGYVVAPTDEEKAQWATENGYVLADAELPAARAEGETDYSAASSKIQIAPTTGSTAVKLLDVLDREDAIYIDARDWNSYLAGHIEGFECIPYFDVIAGNGEQLFTVSGDTVTPRYDESVSLMKKWIPEGRTIILMCQSGGRIVNFMKVLAYCGYDMTQIHNVGGWGSVDKEVYPVSVGVAAVSGTTYSFSAAGLTPYTGA